MRLGLQLEGTGTSTTGRLCQGQSWPCLLSVAGCGSNEACRAGCQHNLADRLSRGAPVSCILGGIEDVQRQQLEVWNGALPGCSDSCLQWSIPARIQSLQTLCKQSCWLLLTPVHAPRLWGGPVLV